MKMQGSKRAVLAVILLMLTTVFAACSDKSNNSQSSDTAQASGSAGDTSPKKTYKIGFANLTEDVAFPVDVRKGIERVAKEKGVKLVLADNKLDGATALSNAENFITQQVDGVIEFQIDEKFGNVIMDKFRAANIPVIAIDIPMPGATFFGADNYKAGSLTGEALGNAIKDKFGGSIDKFIMLELPQSGPIPAARMQGARDGVEKIIGKIPEEKVLHLDSKNTLEEARRVMNDVLQTIPKGQKMGIVTINDDVSRGAVNALQAAGRESDALIGSQGADANGRPEIMREGTPVVGTTAYFPEKYGEYLIPAILDLIEGKPVPASIFMKHEFITKDNMKQFYPNG
ncbi:sugar ABC transporter substrate-binding protein [Cohnella soli]|uniref:Sugar ABC transporter substrate-binding protein n=1 Tax=Cohnella soli TaxID=425005 RepID=A0ABW0HLU7_9BACL